MDVVDFDRTDMDITELDQEDAELLPARQTLSCHHGGYYSSLNLGLGLQLTLINSGRGW